MADGVAASQFSEIQEPEAIIVAPTRELINQIYMEARKFAHGYVVFITVFIRSVQRCHCLHVYNTRHDLYSKNISNQKWVCHQPKLVFKAAQQEASLTVSFCM